VTAATPDVLLEGRQLICGFGANQVLHGIDLTVHSGEIAGVFGLNGAGKSVAMKTLSGLVPLWSGSVHLDGSDITGLSVEDRVGLGIGNVPQGRQVFPDLTVEENLRLGAYTSRRRDRTGWNDTLARVFEQFPVLGERRSQLAGTMSGGQQASLAVARALVNQPRLLLIDEPSAGLAPTVVSELFDILHGVASSGVTMLLVEQNVSFGLRLVETAYILQTGRVVYSGKTESLDTDRVAELLGIGRMLSAATPTLGGGTIRRSPTRARRSRSAAKKKPVAKKKAAAKKRNPKGRR
jgi:branched-chain amino acid transport system ATP-binding protein